MLVNNVTNVGGFRRAVKVTDAFVYVIFFIYIIYINKPLLCGCASNHFYIWVLVSFYIWFLVSSMKLLQWQKLASIGT